MLLADVVRTSNQVSATSSRNAKVSLIADLLRRCALLVASGTAAPDQIGLVTRYLSGALRQRRTGIELSWGPEGSPWSDLSPPQGGGMVTLSEVDSVMQRASDLSGAGSSRERAALFLGLVRRLGADERDFVVGLSRLSLSGCASSPRWARCPDGPCQPIPSLRR